MLTMTDTAAEAVKTIVARVPQAADGGLRIRDAGAETGFELSVAPAPEPDDTVVVTEGARVFLDREVLPRHEGSVCRQDARGSV